jgi:hypothetical protein
MESVTPLSNGSRVSGAGTGTRRLCSSSLFVGLVLYKIWPNFYRNLHIPYGWIWATPRAVALVALGPNPPLVVLYSKYSYSSKIIYIKTYTRTIE